MLTYLKSFGAAEGVDIDEEAIGYCRDRGLRDVRLGEAAKLPYDDGTFDLVTALDVVEHLDDDRPAFAEMRRVLRPGGRLLVTVPAHKFLWGDQDEVNQHKRRYVAAELREGLLASGFEILRLSYMNALLFPPIAAARLLRRLEHRVRPKTPHVSDFRYPAPSPLNFVLGHVFAAEGAILQRVDIPLGVSVMALAEKPKTANL